MEDDRGEICLCCRERGKPGYRVAGEYLCFACESRLADAVPENADYDELLECCRRLWTRYEC